MPSKKQSGTKLFRYGKQLKECAFFLDRNLGRKWAAEALRQLNLDVRFHMRIVGGPGMDCSCRDFLYLRTGEQSLVRECLGGIQNPRILDVGCGIGRHSAFARSVSTHADIAVVEIDQKLRDYCISVVPGAIGHEQFSDVPADARFDIIFLM